jgi:glycerol-3-phosphate dehydrogenase
MANARAGGDKVYDLLIVGGGANGVGIGRDAAGRGLSVLLCEQNDLASATSSASSKLIHGGLRYLEYYEFRLVREALREREVLLAMAPHIIWPLRFVLPHMHHLRPAWMIRIGLFLYDHLGGRDKLPGSTAVDLRADPVGAPLRDSLTKGFIYSDCWVNDARLVVLNAMDAAAKGARVLTRTRCTGARRTGDIWQVTLKDEASGAEETARARILVNAAGPWVSQFLENGIGLNRGKGMRLIKGSHIVVPRLYDGPHAYILQNEDRRVVFIIPYEGRFSLVGTTDVPYDEPPGPVRISAEETGYLCDVVTRHFKKPIGPTDVVWSYSGVRPLYDDAADDASAVTRDYVLDLDEDRSSGIRRAPVLSVFGGKITTYRRLAEHALDKLAGYTPGAGRRWTAKSKLPGGDLPDAGFEWYLSDFAAHRPWLPSDLARRYARAYGSLAEPMLHGARRLGDLGRDFGGGLYEREIVYLIEQEWARSSDDILWRRSKLGLHVPRETVTALEEWLARR